MKPMFDTISSFVFLLGWSFTADPGNPGSPILPSVPGSPYIKQIIDYQFGFIASMNRLSGPGRVSG